MENDAPSVLKIQLEQRMTLGECLHRIVVTMLMRISKVTNKEAIEIYVAQTCQCNLQTERTRDDGWRYVVGKH